jgi:hypothetical protein
MAEENIQGPSGPHRLQANMNPLERAEGDSQEAEDLGIRAPGTAPALEEEPAE